MNLVPGSHTRIPRIPSALFIPTDELQAISQFSPIPTRFQVLPTVGRPKPLILTFDVWCVKKRESTLQSVPHTRALQRPNSPW